MKKIVFILISALFLNVQAKTFDFNGVGDKNSNKILKEFIQAKMPEEDFQVISYFEDINNDDKAEIIGIVKSQYFYSLAGYKLFVLKENNSTWELFKSDIHFDNTQAFDIENKKIIYHKTIFYKNKRCKAKVKKNKIKTTKGLLERFKDKKAHDIEEITKFSEGNAKNNLNIEDFHAQQQKIIDFHYVNLSDRTKHYLDLK